MAIKMARVTSLKPPQKQEAMMKLAPTPMRAPRKPDKKIASIERRQGLKIGCLEEIAYNNQWIAKNKLIKAIKFYGNCSYSDYLKNLL